MALPLIVPFMGGAIALGYYLWALSKFDAFSVIQRNIDRLEYFVEKNPDLPPNNITVFSTTTIKDQIYNSNLDENQIAVLIQKLNGIHYKSL